VHLTSSTGFDRAIPTNSGDLRQVESSCHHLPAVVGHLQAGAERVSGWCGL